MKNQLGESTVKPERPRVGIGVRFVGRASHPHQLGPTSSAGGLGSAVNIASATEALKGFLEFSMCQIRPLL